MPESIGEHFFLSVLPNMVLIWKLFCAWWLWSVFHGLSDSFGQNASDHNFLAVDREGTFESGQFQFDGDKYKVLGSGRSASEPEGQTRLLALLVRCSDGDLGQVGGLEDSRL